MSSSSEGLDPLTRAVATLRAEFDDARRTLFARAGRPAPLGARVYRSTSQSISTGTDTLLSFDTAVIDYGDLFDAGTPTKLTIPTDGVYLVAAGVGWAYAAGGMRRVGIRHDGAYTALVAHAGSTAIATFQQPTSIVELAAGALVDVVLYHDQGGAVTVDAGDYSAWLAAWRLA